METLTKGAEENAPFSESALATARALCRSRIFNFFAFNNSRNFSSRLFSCSTLASIRSSSCCLITCIVCPCSLYLSSRFVSFSTSSSDRTVAVPNQPKSSISSFSFFSSASSPNRCLIPDILLRNTRSRLSSLIVAEASSVPRGSAAYLFPFNDC